jgi:hypothetical protein
METESVLGWANLIVEAHGGTIGCRSEFGVGSPFYFRLAAPPAPAVKDPCLVQAGGLPIT